MDGLSRLCGDVSEIKVVSSMTFDFWYKCPLFPFMPYFILDRYRGPKGDHYVAPFLDLREDVTYFGKPICSAKVQCIHVVVPHRFTKIFTVFHVLF